MRPQNLSVFCPNFSLKLRDFNETEMALQVLAQIRSELKSSVSDLCKAYGGEDGRQNKHTENIFFHR